MWLDTFVELTQASLQALTPQSLARALKALATFKRKPPQVRAGREAGWRDKQEDKCVV